MNFPRIFAAARRTVPLAVLLAACCPAANDALPDVTFRTSQGETVRTGDMKGDLVFVDLWATTCKTCGAMRSAIERLNQRLAAQGIRFLSVNEDADRETWKEYMVHNPSPLIEVWDDHGSFRKTMRVEGLPAAFAVDRGGQVRWRSPKWTGDAEATASAQLDSLLREPPPK